MKRLPVDHGKDRRSDCNVIDGLRDFAIHWGLSSNSREDAGRVVNRCEAGRGAEDWICANRRAAGGSRKIPVLFPVAAWA